MAKKPKGGASSTTDDDESADGAPQKAGGGGRKRLVVIGLAGALVLTGAGGYWFFGRGDAPATQAPAAKPVAFLELREMMVNLSPEPNQDRARLLKFKVALEVSDPKTVPSITPFLPRIEDTFQVFVRELRATDLDGSAGMYRLREELLRRVNIAIYPAKVEAVLFKDIVVQ